MIDVKITKITNRSVRLLWEEDGEYGNIKIVYDGHGGFKVDAEYISVEKFLKVMSNVPHTFYKISDKE